ncbi:MAG: ribosome biogenesis GTPase Der, partial [Gammaproteobacteria bacterium]|nr:ribosome biogenesis GTPase Der [Gammaproteobacteria bacterium]
RNHERNCRRSRASASAATHGDGVSVLRESLEQHLTRPVESMEYDGIPVAVIGRPNVGKSTLVNALLGDERCVVFDKPGTTRDSIYIPFERDDQRYVLIDTAGIRRKGRVDDVVEKFSVVKALDAMVAADVALLVIDATEGIVEQDLHIVSYAVEAGTGLILVVNKVDAMDSEQRRALKNSLSRRLSFAEWIPIHHTSALNRTGIRKLYPKVRQIHRAGKLDVATPELNRILHDAVERHTPPTIRSRSVKLRYVNKLRDHPPSLLVHGNQVESLPSSYRKYLENRFRTALKIVGMPIAIDFRNTENPFGDRRNELTRRQQKHRQRLIQRRKARAKSKRMRG